MGFVHFQNSITAADSAERLARSLSTWTRYSLVPIAISRAEAECIFFLKSDLFICFVHPQSMCADTVKRSR